MYQKAKDKTRSRTNKFAKYGKVYAVVLAIDYLEPRDNLLSILLVNKAWKKTAQKRVYKAVLSEPDEKISFLKRLSIWKSLVRLVNYALIYTLTCIRMILLFSILNLKNITKWSLNLALQ